MSSFFSVQCPDCKGYYVIEITEANANFSGNSKLKHPIVSKVQSVEQEEKVGTIAKSTSHSSIGEF